LCNIPDETVIFSSDNISAPTKVGFGGAVKNIEEKQYDMIYAIK